MGFDKEFKALVKQCLSLIGTATAKDDEISMWINAAILDMKRQSIDVDNNMSDALVKGAIVLYVKSNFGMTDIKEKELAQRTYLEICNNLSLSSHYRLEVEIDA